MEPSRKYHKPSTEAGAQRRAGKACQSCRTRKVKCDVISHGPPCKNCRFSDVPCVIAQCRRGRYFTPYPMRLSLSDHPTRKQKDWYEKQLVPKQDPPATTHVPIEDLFGYKHNSPDSNMEQSAIDSASIRHDAIQPLPLTASATELLNSVGFLDDVPASLKRLQIPMTPALSSPEGSGSEELPPYFLPLPSHLNAIDIEYLRNKGALEIPPLDLRNEIIRAYVEYMHPYMPLMDIDKLLCLIDPHRDPTTIPRFSLLLYQCVLLAGIAFVDEDLVRRHGYPSIKAARKLIYDRTRVRIHPLDVPPLG